MDFLIADYYDTSISSLSFKNASFRARITQRDIFVANATVQGAKEDAKERKVSMELATLLNMVT